MTDPRAQLIAIKYLAEKVKAVEAEVKQGLGLKAGERASADFDGLHLGFVTMARGRASARVVNEEAFLAYVKSRWPGEVEVSERVNPAFQKRILDEAAKLGSFVDADGVIIDGIVNVSVGDPYPVVSKADDLDISMAALVERDLLGPSGLRELEAGNG